MQKQLEAAQHAEPKGEAEQEVAEPAAPLSDDAASVTGTAATAAEAPATPTSS